MPFFVGHFDPSTLCYLDLRVQGTRSSQAELPRHGASSIRRCFICFPEVSAISGGPVATRQNLVVGRLRDTAVESYALPQPKNKPEHPPCDILPHPKNEGFQRPIAHSGRV